MFNFFRRKKKQETPAQEETRIQETAAEAVERVETTVSQTLETVQENIGEKAEELTAAVETAVESAKERAEEIRETVVEHVSETVEHVREAISETSSETVEKVEERVEAARETVAENVSAAVEHVHEAVSEGSSETAETVETVEIQAEAAPATSEEHSVQTLENTAVATSSETSELSEPKLGWAARLKQGLTKSRDKMAKSLAGVFGGGQIDEDLYEELETVLITSDMGIEATEYLMKDVRNRVSLKGLKDGNELRGALKEALYDLIKPLEKPLVLPETKEPFVIMLAGINGAGKTTSIGKLAKYFQAQGKSVLLAAGDTFRAAAREQLQAWGERNNVTVISQTTGDSAAVCFDAVQAAKARGIDIVLADTAGRLPTQLHLMEEIKKVKRVLQKAMPDAPHEIIVVLDANIGQNAVNQVKAFDEALGLTGLIVTKLDGTAKGGILAALASDRPVPVRYIGVGEGIDDLRPFNARAFVDALLD
ncbi:signal recognition particle-docking protein FtsY [Neisseria sp. HMSC15C08]|uniref:signal recognition particle-docking protein FtsY n=1 Tax=Neisseria mucosa TaxID=488 RepID=UPI0008A169F0|nr:signal recognition particle-docking protein FtsY [Neisseria mucosa]OFV30680.1 signal recognition particle-docking protein FtsY [Neisseria sp. HMSC15C08]